MKNNRREFLFFIAHGIAFLGISQNSAAKPNETKLIENAQLQWDKEKSRFPSNIVVQTRKSASRSKTDQLDATLYKHYLNRSSRNIVADFLKNQIILDYKSEETALIDGWILSLTEVSLIVLLDDNV